VCESQGDADCARAIVRALAGPLLRSVGPTDGTGARRRHQVLLAPALAERP